MTMVFKELNFVSFALLTLKSRNFATATFFNLLDIETKGLLLMHFATCHEQIHGRRKKSAQKEAKEIGT
jgi:hypothetical protein